MAHLINRLRFEMNCPDEEQALSVRHNFAQTLQTQITSVIEKLCSQYVPADEWLQIDTIEVDMGQLSPEEFSSSFEKIFLYRFEKELVAKLSGIPAEQRSNSVQQSMLGLLQHFLLKGVLPWWADEDVINLEEVCKDVFTNSEKLIEQFFLKQVNNVAVWQRAAFQLGDDAKKHIVQMLKAFEAAKEVINQMLASLIEEVSALPDEQKKTVLKKLQWQAIKMDDLIIGNAPAIFAAGDNQLQVKTNGAAVLLRLFAATPDFELVKSVLKKVLGGNKTAPTEDSTIKDDREEIIPSVTGDEIKDLSPGFKEVIELKKPIENMNNEGDREEIILSVTGNEIKDNGTGFKNTTELEEHIPEIINYKDNAEPVEEKLLVKGAGIILLTPFLKPFFTKLELIRANEWVNREAQVKAVYMLKYLGNGFQLYKEYQLVLEKLLCGIPIHQPLEAAPEFTQAETGEAEDLLHSVLEHWHRLKNTSVNGLRESFFKRDGILTAKESNWQLQVERKTMDVLLESIPWGFSTVSLPWNAYIIFTEW